MSAHRPGEPAPRRPWKPPGWAEKAGPSPPGKSEPAPMKTSATARFVRLSARKARLVLDQIRGKPVGAALATLEYTPRAAARIIEKVLRSAVANAEHNHQVRNPDDLRVVLPIADRGPSTKRR